MSNSGLACVLVVLGHGGLFNHRRVRRRSGNPDRMRERLVEEVTPRVERDRIWLRVAGRVERSGHEGVFTGLGDPPEREG